MKQRGKEDEEDRKVFTNNDHLILKRDFCWSIEGVSLCSGRQTSITFEIE